jgi:metal-responsive CopG/Arc/MetJ family transcriptional regulator
MRLDRALLKRLDDFRFKHRFESRSEAARWLMKLALDQKPVPTVEGKD